MALSEDRRIDCSNLSEEVLGTSDLIRTGFCRDMRITGCVLSQDRETWLLGHTWENKPRLECDTEAFSLYPVHDDIARNQWRR